MCWTYQSSLGFDERSVLSIHLIIETTSIAEIVTITISSPERCGGGTTVNTLSTLWNNTKIIKTDRFSWSVWRVWSDTLIGILTVDCQIVLQLCCSSLVQFIAVLLIWSWRELVNSSARSRPLLTLAAIYGHDAGNNRYQVILASRRHWHHPCS